jgi:deoxyribose-phosphate aldolase
MNTNRIAKMIDHSVLHPTYTDEDLKLNCEIAGKYHVATVCVRPYHTRQAASLLQHAGVGICAVIGFPHGNSTTGIKVDETRQVITDGAAEVDMVINIGKVLQGDWVYVEKEIKAINDTCAKHNALLKVIFETDYLTTDASKIRLCKICSRLKVGFVKTSTGYGFVKGSDGKYTYEGATEKDIILMRKHCIPQVGIKAAGGIRNLDQLLKVHELGATRIGASATESIMEEAIRRFGNQH